MSCDLKKLKYMSLLFQEQTVKLLVYGDMGSKSGKLTLSALQDELSTGQYQAIFHNGDFGYDLDSNGGSVSMIRRIYT